MENAHIAPVDTTHSPHARLHTLPMQHIVLGDGFWKQRQRINGETSLAHGYRMLEKAGNFNNLEIAAGRKTGDYTGRNFLDSDVYKWLEAVAYELGHNPQNPVRNQADVVIDLIAEAQEDSGYLNSYYQIVEPENHWQDLDHGHELYCAGHLFQAAVAHTNATGDRRLLDIAVKFADHIDDTFGPDKRPGAPGHPEIEMALVELYRATRETRYLDLARFFVDQRGQGHMRGLGWVGAEYHQDRVPVRETDIVEGHAVRAMYLTAAIADIYLETGEGALLDALSRQWQDMTGGKLHVTGGTGARYEGESFGEAYELPNDQCYCETCAAIGNMMWNWRMLLATGTPKFADLMEQILYNGFLSGAGYEGDAYYYINPLLSRGGYRREPWFGVACCPPNIMRTLASMGHYLATTDEDGVQLHLYHSAEITAPLPTGGEAKLTIDTNYPWDGRVTVTVAEAPESEWALSARIPGWCDDVSVRVNGEAITAGADGRAVGIKRVWATSDTLQLNFTMAPHFLEAHPLIEANRGSVAIRRGPVIYCLEDADLPEAANLLAVQIDTTAPLADRWHEDLLGGTMTVGAHGVIINTDDWNGQLYRRYQPNATRSDQPIELQAIPYYAWGHRKAGAMRVWIPRSDT